jgi:hypothetical protein
LLSHPLVLLAAGALLSGILVPAFTRQWQNHAKELDVKADLVKQINASVLPVFDAYRQVETTYARESAVGAADRAYVKWYEGRYAVSDNIDAYFRNAKKLNAAWENFNSSLIGASILLTEPRYFRATGPLASFQPTLPPYDLSPHAKSTAGTHGGAWRSRSLRICSISAS